MKHNSSRINSLAAILTLSLFLFQLVSDAYSCTTFCLEKSGHVACGRNMDWRHGGGVISINPRNLSKTAFPVRSKSEGVNPLNWVSKYGSVTFSFLGREFPSSGINEKGLVINDMWLQTTIYPKSDNRQEVTPLQWIQYQLDTCATVDDVIATKEKVRIAKWEKFMEVPLHFLVIDRTGKTASVEFIDGKMVVHTGKSLPVKTLTNNTYDESYGYLKKHKGFGKSKEIELGPLSINRFVCAADLLKRWTEYSGDINLKNYAYEILGHVAQGNATKWSIVYDINEHMIYYRTNINANLRVINMSSIDFNNLRNAKLLPIDNNFNGNVIQYFEEFTVENSRVFISDFFKKNRFDKNDESIYFIDMFAKYPSTFTHKE